MSGSNKSHSRTRTGRPRAPKGNAHTPAPLSAVSTAQCELNCAMCCCCAPACAEAKPLLSPLGHLLMRESLHTHAAHPTRSRAAQIVSAASLEPRRDTDAHLPLGPREVVSLRPESRLPEPSIASGCALPRPLRARRPQLSAQRWHAARPRLASRPAARCGRRPARPSAAPQRASLGERAPRATPPLRRQDGSTFS